MSHHKGIHHITAIAGDPRQNVDFYAGLLGLRLVKKTVNFDDPSVYHLYYGDKVGRPGTILTFFPWRRLAQGHPGRGQVVAISFSVPTDSFDYWIEYLGENDIEVVEPFTRFGKSVLGLQDPDGLHLELVADPNADRVEGWSGGPVPGTHAIRGFYGATLAEEDYKPTGELLETHLGFGLSDEEHNRYRYTTDAPFGSVIEIIDRSDLNGRQGKGTVHHIAFRAEDDDEQIAVRKRLLEEGYHVTDIKDRQYFRSIYFHETGGVLFEVATDPPGFTKDEPVEKLGSELKLPPWLEGKRNLVEADLPDLEA